MIDINNVYKYFGKFCALNDLNLNINDGELFGFVGSNGAGKTTSLKILSGLIRPTTGTVHFEGENIQKNLNQYIKNIGYMPDFFGVYDNIKVSEYMAFFASIHNISGNRFDSINDRLLRLVHMEDRKNQYVDSLSRGLKQKLCLARCLIHNPKLLILDEPTSGLDPKARIEMKQIIQKLNEQGKTIIISSNILSELSQMCTHLGIIENGKMIIKDSVKHILGLEDGSSTLIITVANALSQAALIIKNNKFVETLSYIGHELRIKFNGTNAEAAELMHQLLSSGIIITEYRSETDTLESLLIELMNKEGNSNEN